MAPTNSNKLAFLSMPAPASYVAGLGRGASGFTTRSDIGPAREGPSAEVVAEAQARRGEEIETDPNQYQDPDNEYGLFADTTYEQDDEEADRIYEQVDNVLDSRRRAKREAHELMELTKLRVEKPKIQQQFADLKRGLSTITDDEWDKLPEVRNFSRRKRRREERSYAVPDSIIVGDRSKNRYENSLDEQQQQTGGFETPATHGELTNLVEIGQARDKVLSLKLDQLSRYSAASGFGTSVDLKGYLTSLDNVVHQSEAQVSNTKHARLLYESLVKSNPTFAPGWISAARVEAQANRMVKARNIIRQGCDQCPKNPDVWLEAVSLHNPHDGKRILANAVQHLPQNISIWLKAVDLEKGNEKAQKTILRKAIDCNPTSIILWKLLVNLESSPVEARVLLSRAVEINPLSVELWLALARLEEPSRAKSVLNKARRAVPTSHEIWIAAARLLEQEATESGKSSEELRDELNAVDAAIVTAVKELRRHQVMLTREQWLKEAEDCEDVGSLRTCEAIVKATATMEIEEESMLDIWLDDARNAKKRGKIVTARSILSLALKVYPGKASLWTEAADLEKECGTSAALDDIFARAVQHCPLAQSLWLRAAKEKWMAGDVPGARKILSDAFTFNPESERIWLAAVKLEAETGELDVAWKLLERARETADTALIWMKTAVFERQHGRIDAALETVATAISKFPKFAKFYMIQGQLYEVKDNIPRARASYAAGFKACPNNPTLWIIASRLEEKDGKSIKARALLEKARLVNHANDVLWAEAIGVETRSGAAVQAKAMLARALQECPSSSILWSMAIWAEPKSSRKSKSTDALRNTKDSPFDQALVMSVVARLFWSERKIEKARLWFTRAVTKDPESNSGGWDWGEIWAWWLAFEHEHGNDEQRETVISRCVAADPHHSPMWQSTAKAIENAGKTTREILEIVSDALIKVSQQLEQA